MRSISGWQTHPLWVRRREIVKITAELFHCNRFPQMHGREKLVNRSGNCETLQGEQLREFTFSRGFHEAFTSQGKKKISYKPSSLLTCSFPGTPTFTLSRRVVIGSAPDVGRMTGAKNSRCPSHVSPQGKVQLERLLPVEREQQGSNKRGQLTRTGSSFAKSAGLAPSENTTANLACHRQVRRRRNSRAT